MADAACVVSVNTGNMHLAAALNVPVVGLHGPTNPARWGPIGGNAQIVRPSSDECCYLNLGWEYPRNPPDCMGAIAVEQVSLAVFRALKLVTANPQ